MAENWSVVRRQDEASRWLQMSEYGFWLYRDSKHLALKKLSIVYHTDNFYVRVHKCVENVHALIALVAGVDPATRPRRNERSIREQTRSALDDKGCRSLLEFDRELDAHRVIQRAREQRNAFVHLFRDEHRDWRGAMLAPVARIREYGSSPDELATELRRIAEPQHLDDYADRKADELFDLLRDIQVLRDKLYGIFLRGVAAVVSTRSAETQEQLRWLLDWAETWRDLEQSADR